MIYLDAFAVVMTGGANESSRMRSALISGAGIAGPAAAWWLNAAGWRTTIVERAPALRSGGYVIDFWGLGYDLAERMGLLNSIDQVGYHMRELRVVGDHGQRRAGFGVSVFDELTAGRFITLARTDLSRLIFEATPATETLFGDEIAALSNYPDGVEVRFHRAGARRFDLVIGADGLHSQVRRLVFGPEEQFERPLGYAVAAFEAEGYRPRDPDVYVMYGKPGRMLGRFTLHGDRSMFLFLFAHDGDLPGNLSDQKSLVRSVFQDGAWETGAIIAALERAGELYLDAVSQIVAPSWSKGRVVLLGDAAFCVSLLAGQGSALAIVAAYVLAGELAGGDIGNGLANYERLLRPYIELKQAGATRFAGALAPRTHFGMWFRNLVMQALGLPGVSKLAVGREITDRLSLPNYPLATAA
jgi:2-polyprenyl-6-methoxyphenol hydroxylase-like FAD-dependent oxidoreductase